MAPSPYADIHREFATARQVSPDGWMTRTPGLFEFLCGITIPARRPYPYWAQVRQDLRSWQIYAYFGFLLILPALMACLGQWIACLVFSGIIVAHYAFLLHITVRGTSRAVLKRARVCSYAAHPVQSMFPLAWVMKETRSAQAVFDTGETVAVCFDMPEMRGLLGQGHRLEVLLEHMKGDQYSSVLAYRIAPPDGKHVGTGTDTKQGAPPMNDTHWHYARGGDRYGPVDTARITDLIRSGRMVDSDLLWTQGWADWVPVAQVKDQFLQGAAPGPVPGQDEAACASAGIDGTAGNMNLTVDFDLGESLADKYKYPEALADASQGVSADGYAGFWRRFAAYLIDGIALAIVGGMGGGVLAFLIAATLAPNLDYEGGYRIGQVFGFLLRLLYFPVMESSPTQATLGKMALGIQVTTLSGERISFLRALGRNLAKYLSGLILFVGFIMAGFTAKKQTLHDMIAGCLVVQSR